MDEVIEKLINKFPVFTNFSSSLSFSCIVLHKTICLPETSWSLTVPNSRIMFSVRKNFNSSGNFFEDDGNKCKMEKKTSCYISMSYNNRKSIREIRTRPCFYGRSLLPARRKLRNVRRGLVLLLRRAENACTFRCKSK